MNRKPPRKSAPDEGPARLGEWDDDGGAGPSDAGRHDEAEREAHDEQAAHRAAFDTSHESARRGEHRYPDPHQTNAERQARDDRDALKHKLGRKG